MSQRILLVEDEEKLRRVVQLHLMSCGFEVEMAGSAEAAVPLLDRADIVLTDLRLPGQDGIWLLRQAHTARPNQPVVLMTAFGDVQTAVEAMKAGAADFVQKPFALDHLEAVLAKVANLQHLQQENQRLKEELGERYQLENLVGRSPAMQEVFQMVLRAAPTRATVLLAGESGTGKDRIARALHFYSPRKDKPFVKINCTSIPENLMESELFGYEKGAFTGANLSKPGKFEQADTGTVFLDEIGDVPPAIQVKLLRILQEREFERLGSNKTRQIDVRVVAATNVDLRAALEQGRFREDLYYRLNVLPINIPSLRERKEDIPFLVEHFLRKQVADLGSPVERISAAALEKMMAYHWPGNVRELENVMERSLVLASGKVLEADEIRLDMGPKSRSAPPVSDHFLPEGMGLEQYEQYLLKEALRRAGNNKSQAARLLGLTRNTLRYRLSQIGIESPGDE